MTGGGFPLSAVVGQEALVEALLACAVDPGVGGVLVRGERGTAKSTAVRALAPLLPPVEGRPVRLVELPVGATADRLVGSLDVEAALRDGAAAFRPGLLAEAHRGVLYVDEVNLLPDHLVDVLLDAAAMGRVHVEREGVSATSEARFVLVGTMNPEEGELRPQLLDRFGLSVEVWGSGDPGERVEVVRRRLAFEADAEAFRVRFAGAEAAVARRIAEGRARLGDVVLDDRMLFLVSGVCARLGVDGMRADIVCARTARALAALDGARAVDEDHVRRAAVLALAHRRRRGPLDPPGLASGELERALAEASEDGDRGPEGGGPGGRAVGGADGGRGGGAGEGIEGNGAGRAGHASEGIEGNGAGHASHACLAAPGHAPEATGDPGPSHPRNAAGGPAPGHAHDTAGDPGAGHAADHPAPGHARDAHRPSRPGPGRAPRTAGGHDPRHAARHPAPGHAADATDPGHPTSGHAGHPAHPPAGLPPLLTLAGSGRGASGRRSRSTGRDGQAVDARPASQPFSDLAIAATLRSAALRRAPVSRADLHEHVRAGREGNLVVFCVDASGSMGARARMQAVKGAILALLLDAYRRRDRVALVTFRDTAAHVVLAPTGSVERAAAALSDVPTGGGTPLAAGLDRAAGLVVAERRRDPDRRALALVVTDGRASGGPAGRAEARHAAARLARAVHGVVVFDGEQGRIRLGLAGELARAAGARLLPLAALHPDDRSAAA